MSDKEKEKNDFSELAERFKNYECDGQISLFEEKSQEVRPQIQWPSKIEIVGQMSLFDNTEE